MKSRPIVFFFLLTATTSASAQHYDGHEFNKICISSKSSTFSSGLGLGLVAAVGDIESIKSHGRRFLPDHPSFQPLFCLPQNSSLGQLFDVACKFSNNNPSHRHAAAVANIQNALIEAFPCPK